MNNIFFLLISFFFTYFFLFFALKNNFFSVLIDYPNSRKKHLNNIPAIGGLVIFSVLICFILSVNILGYAIPHVSSFYFLFLSVSAFFLLGLIDDIYKLNVFLKLFFQILICLFSVLMIDFISEFKWPFLSLLNLNDYSFIISLIFMLIVINGINFLDGVDGLLCVVSIFMLLSFLLLNEMNLIFFYMILIGSLLAFLIFNKPPAKVFLGDSGSLLIGSILVLLFFNYSYQNSINNNFFLPIIVLFLPIIDFIYVVIIRFAKPGSIYQRFINIFSADRKHIHYKILNSTNSSFKTVICMSSFNFIFLIYLLIKNYG